MAEEQKVLSSVHNAIRILREFSLAEKELGISELSQRLGLAKSTVFRLMKTLHEDHLVEKNEETQKYHLGLTAFEIGFNVYHTLEIRLVALPLLDRLMHSVRKVVRLGVYNQGGVVYIIRRAPENDVSTVSKIGNRVPAYCTAIGKVLLAHKPEEEIDKVLSAPLKAYTPRTVVSPGELRKQLAEIKQAGYAVTSEELRPGVSSVAVPIFNDAGDAIAALSVTGMKSFFYTAQINYYVKELKTYSRLITEKLGLKQ